MSTIQLPADRVKGTMLAHMEELLGVQFEKPVTMPTSDERQIKIAKAIERCILLQEETRFDIKSVWVSTGTTYASESRDC